LSNTYYSTFEPSSSAITSLSSVVCSYIDDNEEKTTTINYYTINSGTYNVQIFNLNSNGGADSNSPITYAQSYTFGTSSPSGSATSQSITQN
jgi:hypothetical protein